MYPILDPSSGVYALQHSHQPQGLEGHGSDVVHHSHSICPLKDAHALYKLRNIRANEWRTNTRVGPLIHNRNGDFVAQM